MIAAVVASVGFILMGVGIIVISLFWGCATNSSCTITTAYNEMEYGFALVFVVYWSWATFYIAATGVIVFSVISWAGLTVPSTLRMIRRAFVGPYRPAVPAWKRRRFA